MNTLKLIYLLVLTASLVTAGAQNITLIEENVPEKLEEPQKGPNQKKFLQGFIGYGLILGGSEGKGGSIIYGNSGGWHFGIRQKRKISNFYSLGYEISYNINTFSLKQDSTKLFPNSLLHEKEHLRTNELGIGIYNRFNFGKRGNYVGNFIDLGFYGTWIVGASHTYFDKYTVANNANASNTTTTNRGLIYISNFSYGPQARIGFNRFVLFANYRLSNLFNGKITSYPELPRLITGIQIGLHS
jgi:hypothetical protein